MFYRYLKVFVFFVLAILAVLMLLNQSGLVPLNAEHPADSPRLPENMIATPREPVHLIRIPAAESRTDRRNEYALALLATILSETEQEFGPFNIELAPAMNRDRQLSELVRGDSINLVWNASSIEWEEQANAIIFPIRRGLQKYRLLLIDAEDAPQFATIKSVAELKKLRAGLDRHWLTADVMQTADFNLVFGNDYEGLFKMLELGRFDYFPRTISEIFYEYEFRVSSIPSLIIEPTIALQIPSASFYFVNKKDTRLHQRIERGLWKMHRDGSLMTLFNQFHDEKRYRETLAGRKLFFIDNPFIREHDIYQRKDLWFKP